MSFSDANAAAPRPSRRALHRRAVKSFRERKRNGDRRRAAADRDGRLFLSAAAAAPAPSADRARVVLVGRWDFDFFFRTMPSDLLETAPPAAAPLYSAAEQSLALVHSRDTKTNPRASAHSGSDRDRDKEKEKEKDREKDEEREKDRERERGGGGRLASRAALPQSAAPGPKSVHVRRVDGAPPLPMIKPMRAGTDLDDAPSNYLVPDTEYNVHQHAPGFERDEGVATRALFTSALREWRGGDDSVLVLTNGETMRNVFDSVEDADKPLVLRARRIGPTLLVDSHGASAFPLTRVRDLRGKALVGKALYRIREETTQAERSEAAEKGAVALPMHRVGSAAVAKERHLLSRHSHILCWEIGEMDVMVGLDTPIVLDRRDNTEQMLLLEDSSVQKTPQEVRREVLGSWFDATLANVAHVGMYVHHDGVIQRYEVRKVQDLLGLVEGHSAAAAMNFTTSVLQWLVSQCTRDGTTYALIRNYESDALEIYECASDDRLEQFLANGGDDDDDDDDEEEEEEEEEDEEGEHTEGIQQDNKLIIDRHSRDSHDGGQKKEIPMRHKSTGDGHNANNNAHRDAEEARRREEETDRINRGLANMCFRMGMHLKDSTAKVHDAVSLLLRSFAIYMQMSDSAEAMRAVRETAAALPAIIGRFVDGRRAALSEQGGGAVQLPEIHRDALLTCGRFQVRLEDAVADVHLPLPVRRAFLHCLIPCGAALCVCVARAMIEFRAERSASQRLREAAAGRQAESSVHIRSLITKDLLQVVVEGLLRLEHISHLVKNNTTLLRCVYEASNTGRQCDVQKEGMNREHRREKKLEQGRNKKNNKEEQEEKSKPKEERDAVKNADAENVNDGGSEGRGPQLLNSSPSSQFALIDPATDLLDVAPLNSALCELYGDVVLLAMGDRTPFTVGVLEELSRRIAAREERRAQTDPSARTHEPATTLAWLSTMTTDVVALSFTALRFFTKSGTQSKRLLTKTAQVYCDVGHHYLLTDRYTKALEALHRAQSLLCATAQAPPDAIFGDCCAAAVSLKDVRRALGLTYSRMARASSLSSPRVFSSFAAAQPPLAFGAAQPLPPETESLFRRAVDHLSDDHLSDAHARAALAATLRLYASRLVAHIANIGVCGDAAKARHIWALLRRAGEIAKGDAAADEWEVLRIATCCAPHAALLRRADEIAERWASNVSLSNASLSNVSLSNVSLSPLASIGGAVGARECALQLSLVAAVRLEARRCAAQRHRAAALARECAHFAAAALSPHFPADTNNTNYANNANNANCAHEWAARAAVRVALRATRAAGKCMPADSAARARRLGERLTAMEKDFPESKTGMCDGSCAFAKDVTPAVLAALAEMEKW